METRLQVQPGRCPFSVLDPSDIRGGNNLELHLTPCPLLSRTFGTDNHRDYSSLYLLFRQIPIANRLLAAFPVFERRQQLVRAKKLSFNSVCNQLSGSDAKQLDQWGLGNLPWLFEGNNFTLPPDVSFLVGIEFWRTDSNRIRVWFFGSLKHYFRS